MNRRRTCLLVLPPSVLVALVASAGNLVTGEAKILSPDGRVQLTILLDESRLKYELAFAGKPVIERSPVTVLVDDVDIADGVQLGDVKPCRAFQPPKSLAPRPVRHEVWPKRGIDRFILARLEEAGLEPNPPADRRTWIRRVTFDLIGLPPKPEEIEAFVNDSSSGADSDRATAALLIDLRQRGLLDDTLVIWGGEFGRTPYAEIGKDKNPGRSRIGSQALGGHDLHATILYLLGMCKHNCSWPLATSQSRNVISALPLRARRPSAEKATLVTEWLCPAKRRSSSPRPTPGCQWFFGSLGPATGIPFVETPHREAPERKGSVEQPVIASQHSQGEGHAEMVAAAGQFLEAGRRGRYRGRVRGHVGPDHRGLHRGDHRSGQPANDTFLKTEAAMSKTP